MNIIKNIIVFFKKIFNGKNNIKMIEAPVNSLKEEKTDFVNSLKVNIVQKHKKKKVETLTCFGDGLGIQNKMTY